ncbi:LuxR C-terminal-related transcriptional regulator [Micrococcaceae bacterium Sec5.8]
MTAATDSHRVTVVAAPAGYGKSTLLGDWVRNSDLPCGWLALDRFDTQPARLFHGVVGAIQAAASPQPLPGNDALLALSQNLALDRAASYDLLLGALEQLTEPVVLVIDDVHLAGPGLSSGIVGVLAASAPPALRLVLSGRGHPAIQLEKLRYGEGLGEVGGAELAFTRAEVAMLAHALGHDDNVEAGSLWGMTAGWPVAVHAGLSSLSPVSNLPGRIPGFTTDHLRLADYIAEEVLDQLDPSLADFILRATTCNRLGRGLAVELQDGPDGGRRLEACLRDGLFIEEHERQDGESLYRWHGLFAAQCRRILERRDPVLAETLHSVAARHFEDADVTECLMQARQGHAPAVAVESLGRHWLAFLLQNGAEALEKTCRDLPAPWCEDPEVLMIRSVCRTLDGDQPAASELTRFALTRTSTLDSVRRRIFDQCRALFEPVTADGNSHLRVPAADVGSYAEVTSDGRTTGSTGLFLAAQAEFRLHRVADQATVLLQSGAEAGAERRLEALEAGSKGELALAWVAAGDVTVADDEATQALEIADGLGSQEHMAAAWLARGIVFYWRDELKGARAHLAKARRLGGADFPIAPLGVVYRVLVDCALGDRTHLAESTAALEAHHDRGLFGGSWHAFHTVAKAKIAEAGGDLAGALVIIQPLGAGGHAPLVDALLAELLRRAGDAEAAQRCTQAVTDRSRNRYIDASLSLTEALLAHGNGDQALVHERIEHAAHRAEPQAILLPFAERSDELAELLIRHAVWGTAHEAFIAARVARHAQAHQHLRNRSYWTLTDREREVLAYMRSVMTAAEIAEALYISVNTVKTHERSIYRKLGAAGRRDALKTAAERGIV